MDDILRKTQSYLPVEKNTVQPVFPQSEQNPCPSSYSFSLILQKTFIFLYKNNIKFHRNLFHRFLLNSEYNKGFGKSVILCLYDGWQYYTAENHLVDLYEQRK